MVLYEGYLQTTNTVALERALPNAKLLLSELITGAGFLHRDLAVAHRNNHRSFAASYPAPGIRGR
jgi:hypothetical protein